MKFYELDLRQIIPYGIPLNTESHVEYTSHINDFFLQGFEGYFSRLFTVDDGNLQTDYSRSCTAPNSLYACQFCTDAQIEASITEAGFAYYPTNSHATNAQFMYDLNNIQFGTENWLTAIARYTANSSDISAKPLYEGKEPYHYGIYINGDIVDSANTGTILNRIIENLKVVGTAHTQVDEFVFEDTSSRIETNAAVAAIDAGIFCEVEIVIPYDVWLADVGNGRTAVTKGIKDYFNTTLLVGLNIANAAPTALSSFNTDLNGAGGPYTQIEANQVMNGLAASIKAYEPNWTGTLEVKPH